MKKREPSTPVSKFLIERAISLEDAETKVHEVLEELNLCPVLDDYGYNNDSPSTWRCILLGTDGVAVDRGAGSGKGSHHEAKVGALFEALEHLLTSSQFLDLDAVQLHPASHFVTSDLSPEASIALLADVPNQELASVVYKDLQSGDQIDAPLYLSSPWYVEDPNQYLRTSIGDIFDYSDVARYSINSGSAIGSTENEATVHALNEVIERDGFSLLLIRSFLGKGEPPTLVDPMSLPREIRELFYYVENQLGTSIYLLNITTEVDVPSYLAYVPPTADKSNFHGAGASLSPRHAAYRALSELLQHHLLTIQLPAEANPFGKLEPLRDYPRLYKCGRFDLTELLPSAKMEDFSERLAPVGPEAHLAELVKKVSVAGFSAYQRQVHSFANGITAVHVLIPGMEHFLTVKEGALIAPGERGVRAVQSS